MKYFFRILLMLVLLYHGKTYAQKGLEVAVNQTIIINYVDHVVYANVLANDPRISPANELFYFWYKANDIKKSRGGYEGRLLHGIYTVYYPNKNLKEKGTFKFGIKTGVWKSWHYNGELSSIVLWKKGLMHGHFFIYNDDGSILTEGKYKHGLLDGVYKNYTGKGVIEISKYKKGIKKVKKTKVKKERAGIIRRKIRKLNFRKNPDTPGEEKKKEISENQDQTTINKETSNQKEKKKWRKRLFKKDKKKAEPAEDKAEPMKVNP